MKTAFALAAVYVLVACGGPPRPKIKEIEELHNSSGTTSVSLQEITYKDNKLDTLSAYDDGVLQYSNEFFYEGDKVKAIEWLDDEGVLVLTFELSYKDGRVVEGHVFDDSEDSRVEVDYDDDRVSKVTTVSTPTGGTARTRIERYDYDKDNRLTRITEQEDGESDITNVSYDDDNAIKRVETVANGNTTTFNMGYDDDGRLSRVTEGSTRYDVAYDEGRTSEVTGSFGTNFDITTSFKYGDGDMDGVLPTGGTPWAEFFNIEGKRFDKVELTTAANLFN